MMQTEALRLALQALEKLFGIPDKWTGEGGGDVAVWRLGGSYRAQQAINGIKASLEAKDEPWEKFCDSHCVWTNHHPDCKLAQRTWVGLTDDEIVLIVAECAASHQHTDIHFAKAIEAKLKEKNT